MVTVIGITAKTKKVEETLRFIEEKKFGFQEISLIMQEAEDVPQDYFQKLGLIDNVLGSQEGITPVAIPGLNQSVYIAGPIAGAIGIDSDADSSVDASQTIIGPLAGGFVNAMMDIGIHEDTAKIYQDMINKGNIFIGLTVEDTKEEEIVKLFEKEGLTNITVLAE